MGGDYPPPACDLLLNIKISITGLQRVGGHYHLKHKVYMHGKVSIIVLLQRVDGEYVLSVNKYTPL